MPNKLCKPIYTSIMTNNFLEQFTTSCKGYKYTKCCFCFHWLLELNLCTSWLIRETFHWKNIGNFWPGPTRRVGLKLLNREFTSMIWSDSEIKSNRGINLDRKRIQFPVSLLWLRFGKSSQINSEFKMVASEMETFVRIIAQLLQLERSILEIRNYWRLKKIRESNQEWNQVYWNC